MLVFFGKLGVVIDNPSQYFNESDFYDKVCLMLDIDLKELNTKFEQLIQYYEDLDDYLTNDEIIEKLNFFRDNIEHVEEDNLEMFFSLPL